MPPPTLVIIPTSFAFSSTYDGQAKFLRDKGFSVHVLDPPTYPANYTPSTPASSMYDDARFISTFVTDLADRGEDIIILAHSYGGCPTSQSLQGLTKDERASSGRTGGVVRIAFLSGVAPELGKSTFETVTASAKGEVPRVDVDQYGWMSQSDYEQTAKKVFNSLSLDEGIERSKALGRHSAPAFSDPLTSAGYRNVLVSWYFCEDDLSVVDEVQQNAIKVVEKSWEGTPRQGQKVDITRNKCDHMPMFSAPDHLNKWLEKLVSSGNLG